ncbi:hypothetical protein EDE08_10934 [Bradyrhizobium sp. R2.2-H]|nr:hypothetical protein EDE10_109379 [Bradyrhizobium sp. Y-H1]TCU69818.1 hypothetical protein EDE08_10934 [Bradyrhizobium sp. R2.2-H]
MSGERADGATIDARCSHRDEYHAVQRCVTAAEGIVVGVEVEHGAAIASTFQQCESDAMTVSENDRGGRTLTRARLD